jgi:hypothetical protein
MVTKNGFYFEIFLEAKDFMLPPVARLLGATEHAAIHRRAIEIDAASLPLRRDPAHALDVAPLHIGGKP